MLPVMAFIYGLVLVHDSLNISKTKAGYKLPLYLYRSLNGPLTLPNVLHSANI